MSKNRTKKAIANLAAGAITQIITIVCGFILPRLILNNYGSAYNGITHSISQFISYIALMKTGIGGATRAALYKPLAENDNIGISKVLASTQKFMRRIAGIFVIFVLAFAIIYPLYICKDFDFVFTSTLIIIISISTFAEYYFGFTYQMLLMADQKQYVTTFIDILAVVLNTVLAVLLINNGFSIHVVKGASVLVSLILPLYLYFYVRKKYNIVDVKGENINLAQKWDATAHEIASFVNNNTDIVVLTFFSGLLEVSVYTVYHYVISKLKSIVAVLTSSFAGAFGSMYAKKEYDLIEENLGIYELIVYSSVSILYSVTVAMIVSFALLYTKNVNDVSYDRPLFAIILTLAGAFDCFRTPYKTIVTAAGHFKQTRNGAIFEAILNIVISVTMVFKFGIVGVAIGTLCAMMFRTCQYAYYLSKNIINRSLVYFIKHIVICLGTMVLIYTISKLYLPSIDSWIMWIAYSFVTTILAIILTLLGDYIFYRKDFNNLISKVFNSFRKKRA